MDYEIYYKDYSGLDITSTSGDELHAKCPFHDDNVASLSVNKKTGLWKCFGGCQEGGNVFQFHAKLNASSGMTVARAKKDILIKMGEYKVIDTKVAEDAAVKLRSHSKFNSFLLQERGLSEYVVKHFQLGTDGHRIFIPVYDEDGDLVNIRKYLPHAAEQKVISYAAGYGKSALFPIQQLKYHEVYLMEGEMDCLLAMSLGLKAMIITGGAGTPPTPEMLEKLRNKIVNICYDIDEAGVKGANKVAAVLSKVARVRLIQLPITEPAKGDFTDYIVQHKHTVEQFNELVSDTPFMQYTPDEVLAKETDKTVYEVDLNEAAQHNYYYKNTKMKVIISGKDLAPYFAPHKLTLTCKQGMKMCKFCPLNLSNGRLDVEFPLNTNEILQLIRCTNDKQKQLIRQKVNIPKCNNFEIVVDDIVNVEEIRVIPEINFASKDMEYVTRNLYYIGYGIKTNRSYELEGIVVPDPTTQYATQIVHKASPTQSSVDQFKMTPELFESLKVFQAGEDVRGRIDDINKDLTYNITKIYGREDLITAVDLIYHSVLKFKFQNQPVQKGWTDGLIIGDTRCGKTESLVQLISHYRLGELCTGENISYAGLVGGMSQAQQRWSISWGKIPLNDRRLVVIDEVSSLDVDTISNLSALRSSGVAEIIKIQTERTNARTRLIWVSNPRSGRKLDTYNYGVLAIKELIGKVEDVARFDFAIAVAHDEVPIEIINAYHDEKVPHIYHKDICNQLILWAWSRREDQVHFTRAAEELILKHAMELGRRYSPSVPLVEAAEQRIKLARLSVAIAARTFSTEDGEVLLVKPCHVQFVTDYLNKIYSTDAMGYSTFSLAYSKITKLDEETMTRLTDEFKEFSTCFSLRELLLEYQAFRKSELIDQTGYDIIESKKLFKWMSSNKFIKTTPIGYVKQPIFTSFLKNMKITKEDNNEFDI